MFMDKNFEQRMLEAWHQRKPHQTIFAFISILLPFVGVSLSLGVIYLLPADPVAAHMGLRDFYYITSILFLSVMIGALSGLIALVRRERHQKIVLAGLLLNCVPLLLMFVFSK